MKNVLMGVALMLAGVGTYAQPAVPEIGVARDMEDDALMYASGYRHFVESIGKIMSPQSVTDEEFAARLKAIRQLKTNLYAVNIFIPGNLKTVGPEVDEEAILAYTQKVFERCQQAGVGMVVWGSGGSRRVPEGFDYQQAVDQFVSIAGKVARQAQQYGILLTLENLNSTETNFLNRLSEVIDVVKRVDEPNLRVCVDIYHMLKDGEPAEVIDEGRGLIEHCDIAEKEGRTAPGIAGNEVVPYLRALKRIDYSGKIIVEARWTSFEKEAPATVKYLEGRIKELWK